jgi:hypothetical protein
VRPALALCAVVLAIALSACTPEPEAAAPAYADLDCSLAFEAQVARVEAQSGLKPAPKDPNEPYRFLNSADAKVSYMITEAGAPGHPAILMQRASPAGPVNSGCSYGDKAGYQQLVAYLESLRSPRS